MYHIMGQLVTRLTGGIEKTDVNPNYQTYGDGDTYAIDGNGYYQPSDYDDMEETSDRMNTGCSSRIKVLMTLLVHDYD